MATTRGWDTKLAPSLQTTARYDDKGVMGSGRWYGVPNYGELVTGQLSYEVALSKADRSSVDPYQIYKVKEDFPAGFPA